MDARVAPSSVSNKAGVSSSMLTHLQRLEAESIHIFREVVAECENPVMLYSIGKDSAVMLRLAMKAFYPSKPPFPLLHVDTTWKFRAMYEMRERMARETGMELIVHKNPEAEAKGIGCMSGDRYQRFYDSMIKAGVLDAGLDVSKAFTNRFVCKGVGLDLYKKLAGG